jgi:hypothetical protein
MKIAVIGDTHLGRKLKSFNLTPYIFDVMNDFFYFCIKNNVDMAIHMGDVFDTPRPDVDLVSKLILWVNAFEENKTPLFLLTGNHDVVSGCRSYSALEPLKNFRYQHVTVVDSPMVEEECLFLPFPSFSLYENSREWELEVSEIIKNRSFKYVFSHLNIDGIPLGEQDWVYRGGSYNLPLRELKDKDLHIRLVNGHIHKKQWFSNVDIVGSAQRLRFSERTHHPAFMLYDTEIYGYRENVHYDPIKMLQFDLTSDTWRDILYYASDQLYQSIVKCNFKLRRGEVIDVDEVRKYLEEFDILYFFPGDTICTDVNDPDVAPDYEFGDPLTVASSYIKEKIGEGSEAIFDKFKHIYQDCSQRFK